MNSRYAKGYRAEKKSRAWLERRGYFVVEARGSHGACDLVAVGDFDDRIVQVKSGRKITPGERATVIQAMAKIPRRGNIVREIHHWDDRAREPRVEIL